ncbi:MAG TPA: hypothetical protein VMV51_13300 [Gemmatimonadaceae bacterium]|nr:hypothetical protein [Gemmatimonadaceae bacterium]
MLLLVGVAACGQMVQLAGGPMDASALVDPDSSTITVTIDNRNWADVVVYLAHDGLMTRLGTIRSAKEQDFQVPIGWTGNSRPLQLVAHSIGATSSFTSESFVVGLGQTVTWLLQTQLSRSSLSIN